MTNKITYRIPEQPDADSGFTIIEVMIVLAIAALIMVIVFLAVPILQRNSRNYRRMTDVDAIAAGLDNYISENNGEVPTGLANDTVNTSSLLFGTLADYYGTSTQGNNESITLGYYQISTVNLMYEGSEWYADGYGQWANILTDNWNIFIVAMLPTATQVTQPTLIPAGSDPTPPTGNGGLGGGGTISTESVTIIPGETCNAGDNGAGQLVPDSVAVFYVLESGSGNGNLECLEST